MQLERSGGNLVEVLDRVLDKGIVIDIDAFVRVSVVGLRRPTVVRYWKQRRYLPEC